MAPAEVLEPAASVDITWTNHGCEDGVGGVSGLDPDVCPHPTRWLFTENDAQMAYTCTVSRCLQAPTYATITWDVIPSIVCAGLPMCCPVSPMHA